VDHEIREEGDVKKKKENFLNLMTEVSNQDHYIRNNVTCGTTKEMGK